MLQAILTSNLRIRLADMPNAEALIEKIRREANIVHDLPPDVKKAAVES